MAEKILYILGAGASVRALPLAKSIMGNDINPVIEGLSYSLKVTETSNFYGELKDKSLNPLLTEMRDRFANLAVKADEFGDVDTYAKYLNLMQPGGQELIKLKRTLSEYFAVKQILMKVRDNRYLHWLVSIMDKKIFPDNVKILNWNYDFQVELAAAQIGSLEDVDHKIGSFTYGPSTFSHYPNLDPTFSEYHLLSLIHLNGVAGFSKSAQFKSGSVFQGKYSNDLDSLLLFMKDNEMNSQLHFAWEKSAYHSSLMQHMKSMIDGTTILVVIGYSFPFFNREIDKEIMNLIKDKEKFQKIYYQDPVLTGQQLRAQFGISSRIEIVHIKNTDNFHIPFEY